MYVVAFLAGVLVNVLLSFFYALLGWLIVDLFNVPYLQDWTYWQILGVSVFLALATTKVSTNIS